jgi:hypothetical protein
MADHKLEFFELTSIAAGVPIHDGAQSGAYPDQVPAFSIQAKGASLLIGDETSIASDIGFTLEAGQVVGWGDLKSRGTDVNYDLKTVYIKGAGSAILNLETPTN